MDPEAKMYLAKIVFFLILAFLVHLKLLGLVQLFHSLVGFYKGTSSTSIFCSYHYTFKERVNFLKFNQKTSGLTYDWNSVAKSPIAIFLNCKAFFPPQKVT